MPNTIIVKSITTVGRKSMISAEVHSINYVSTVTGSPSFIREIYNHLGRNTNLSYSSSMDVFSQNRAQTSIFPRYEKKPRHISEEEANRIQNQLVHDYLARKAKVVNES